MTPTPPGRAGRTWLRRRLDTAARARDTLEVKLGRLQEEQAHLDRTRHGLTERWQGEIEEAEEWLLRALLQGGAHALDLASPAGGGAVTIRWASTMGVHHPADADYRPPAPDPTQVDTGTAVTRARAAYLAAACTGVRVAAATDAVRALAAEAATTRRRLRALDRRVVPRLQTAVRGLELDLEERDHAEHTARRRSVSMGSPRR
jgi:V/A-type H+/Na+-transporting ATPase subunit D